MCNKDTADDQSFQRFHLGLRFISQKEIHVGMFGFRKCSFKHLSWVSNISIFSYFSFSIYCFSSVRPSLRPKKIFRLCISCFYISHHCMTPMFVNEENCTIYKQFNKYYIFTCLYSIKCYYHMYPLFIYNLFLDIY